MMVQTNCLTILFFFGLLVTAKNSSLHEDFPDLYICTHPSALIRQIDHVLLNAVAPSEADLKAAYMIFERDLQFPPAWPWGTYDNGTTLKGGVGAGQVNIEFIFSKDAKGSSRGFAFEPCSTKEDTRAELEKRGIFISESRHAGFPLPFQDYTSFPLHTTSSDTTFENFICKYGTPERTPGFIQSIRREALWKELVVNRRGGPLGVLGGAQVLVAVPDMDSAVPVFQSVLDPNVAVSEPPLHIWKLAGGPSLALYEDTSVKETILVAVVIEVINVDVARKVLSTLGVLGPDHEHCVTINLDKYNVRIVAIYFCDQPKFASLYLRQANS